MAGSSVSDFDKSLSVGLIVDNKNRRDKRKYTTRRASRTAESKTRGDVDEDVVV